MARRNRNTNKQDDTLVDIVEAKEQAGDFLQENQKTIMGGLLLLLVLIGGIFAYNNLYKAPKEKEATLVMGDAEFQFKRDSFALALDKPNGPNSEGFLDIIANYSGTKAANLANYYAGICWLNIGNFDQAISYLEDFSPNGSILPIMKNGALGDAYSEKNDFKNALSYYTKASNSGDNEVLTAYYLKKLGLLHEMQGDYKASAEAFNQIKSKYPTSPESTNIDKYINRVNIKI